MLGPQPALERCSCNAVLFDSIEFLVFLPTVFFAYWFIFQKHLRLQNSFILAVSYLFYGWWDYRYSGSPHFLLGSKLSCRSEISLY